MDPMRATIATPGGHRGHGASREGTPMACADERGPALRPVPPPYAEHVAGERERVARALPAARKYWRERWWPAALTRPSSSSAGSGPAPSPAHPVSAGAPGVCWRAPSTGSASGNGVRGRGRRVTMVS
jgi:hypothetical protein